MLFKVKEQRLCYVKSQLLTSKRGNAETQIQISIDMQDNLGLNG